VLGAERDRLAGEVERLKTENASLRAKPERRAAKRQAAPFSKDRRKPDAERKRPGRKPGADHARHGHRQPPERPDEEIQVNLPEACPHCGSDLVLDRWSEQYQDELVAAIIRRRYR
jgi:transposase